jgi:hypothetical protein
LHIDAGAACPAERPFCAWAAASVGRIIDRFVGRRSGFWRQPMQNVSRLACLTLVLVSTLSHCELSLLCPRLVSLAVSPLFILKANTARVSAHLGRQRHQRRVDLVVLQQFKPDLVVSFHFDQILRSAFLEAVVAPVLNVHPALLPAHRGPCPSFWALAAGDPSSGITIHRIVDASIDTGEPVARRERPVPPGLCVAELDECLFRDGARVFTELLTAGSSHDALGPPILSQLGLSPPHSSGSYESFPARSTVRAARRRGVRLWRLAHAVRLLMQLFGWRRA